MAATTDRVCLPVGAADAPLLAVPEPSPDRPDRRSRVLVAIVLGALVAALLASGHHRATMAFGDSHDGRNAGVWAGHSRSLRQEGPIRTRLGTRTIVAGQETPYASHPPLIGVETAVAEALLGEHPWATRLPAWGGSLAALLLAFLLLRACRLRPLAAAVGVALGFGGPMFATYGTMLDTPMVGLPFGIAVLWLWQRGRSGRPAPPPVVALVSVLAALTSWLGLLTAVLVAGAVVVAHLRRRPERAANRPSTTGEEVVDSPASGFVAGAAIGGVLVVLWISWAYGSLRPLADQFLVRTGEGSEPIGLATFVAVIRAYWSQVFTPWQLLLAIPALVAAGRRRATRAVALLAVGIMVVWVGGMRDGAVHHDYWAYWMVIPLALGIGVLADAALAALQPRHERGTAAPQRRPEAGPGGAEPHPGAEGRTTRMGPVALAGCATALALVGVLAPSPSGTTAERGAPGGAAVRSAAYPPGQQHAWYLGDIIQPADWVTYDSHRPAVELPDAGDVSRLAASAPDDLVLVDAVRLRSDVRSPGPDPGCRAGVPSGQGYAVLRAATLAANLARPVVPCPT